MGSGHKAICFNPLIYGESVSVCVCVLEWSCCVGYEGKDEKGVVQLH